MLIHFKIDEYSRISDLDLLLSRLSERKISYLKLEKIQNEYDFEYTFSQEEIETPTPKELYDAVFSFRKNFLGKKLKDASIHYFMDQDRMIINFSVISPAVNETDLILDAVIHIERAVDLLGSSSVANLEPDLYVKTAGSRKFKRVDTLGSLQEVLKALSTLPF